MQLTGPRGFQDGTLPTFPLLPWASPVDAQLGKHYAHHVVHKMCTIVLNCCTQMHNWTHNCATIEHDCAQLLHNCARWPVRPRGTKSVRIIRWPGEVERRKAQGSAQRCVHRRCTIVHLLCTIVFNCCTLVHNWSHKCATIEHVCAQLLHNCAPLVGELRRAKKVGGFGWPMEV